MNKSTNIMLIGLTVLYITLLFVSKAIMASSCDTACLDDDRDDHYACLETACKYFDFREGQEKCGPDDIFHIEDKCYDQKICMTEERGRSRSVWESYGPYVSTGWYCLVNGLIHWCGEDEESCESPCPVGCAGSACTYYDGTNCVAICYGDWDLYCGYGKCSGCGPLSPPCTYPTATCQTANDCD